MQLETVKKEVNARPLVYVGGDIDSTISLSPKHFLTLNPNTGIPELEPDNNATDYSSYKSTAERLLQTWKKGQKLLNLFWKVWRDEYLLSLGEQTQSVLTSRQIQSHLTPDVDDIVLIKEGIPRGCWRVGTVVSLVFSLDGCVRSAKVALSSGRVIARPLNLLFLVEVSKNMAESRENCEQQPSVSSKHESSNLRKMRTAAKQAKEKIKKSFIRLINM